LRLILSPGSSSLFFKPIYLAAVILTGMSMSVERASRPLILLSVAGLRRSFRQSLPEYPESLRSLHQSLKAPPE